MADIRLHVDAPLSPGAGVAVDAGQAHYLKNVMRRNIGDGILLFNGVDGEWRAEIFDLAKRGGLFLVQDQTRSQTDDATGPWLLFAPVKRQMTNLIVEKAVELGAALIWPVMTQQTNSERVRLDRLQTIAIEAAEQCGRLSVPEILAPEKLEKILNGWRPERRLLVMDETGGGRPISEVLGAPRPSMNDAILIGPEGGFAEVELDALTKFPFVSRAGLGGRTLRAETAAIAALSCWQAALGDWRQDAGRPTL
ncbi:MAG: 16S rRNA (uracil(1498)-N(3))-methyltransferase [Rhodospirillales bacterium]|nr:16S rRNA (uracil(1498)-N(3))-methyltransferase [Rhodospirillales bacterium]